jgi:hypothetical protein
MLTLLIPGAFLINQCHENVFPIDVIETNHEVQFWYPFTTSVTYSGDSNVSSETAVAFAENRNMQSLFGRFLSAFRPLLFCDDHTEIYLFIHVAYGLTSSFSLMSA